MNNNQSEGILSFSKSSSQDEQQSRAIALSFMAILATEIGDKTFLISAIMAMKNPRLIIFSATMTAMSLMTVVSAYLGHIVPSFIDKKYTQLLAAILFLIFGLKMLKEGHDMTGNESQEEMEEVNELLNKDQDHQKNLELDVMESGGELPLGGDPNPNSSTKANNNIPTTQSNSHSSSTSISHHHLLEGFKNLLSLVFSPIFVQTFTLTFLAEWGDRSQIATIALASSKDWFLVSVGAIIGHSLCTAIAVIGGKLLAEKISIKTVTLVGGALFILFGFIAFYESSEM